MRPNAVPLYRAAVCAAIATVLLLLGAEPSRAQTRYWSFAVLDITQMGDDAHSIRLQPLPPGKGFPQSCKELLMTSHYDLSEWSPAGRQAMPRDGHDRSVRMLLQAQVTGDIVRLGVFGRGFGAESEATACEVLSLALTVFIDPTGNTVILSAFEEPTAAAAAVEAFAESHVESDRRDGRSREMSIVECRVCHLEWAATVRPCCPTCLLDSWLSSPNLISDKHHPENSSTIHDDYRSVVSDELIANLRSVLADAVMSGTWYYNVEYEKFNHVTRMPLHQKPGSGLRPGNRNPDRHLEDLVVADADQDPHVFADDRNETRRKIETGIYRPLEACSRAKCDNLRPPRGRHCVIHLNPPLAIRRLDGRHPNRRSHA